MFSKPKTPEPTPQRREYRISGVVPYIAGRQLVPIKFIESNWNAWEEKTGNNGQPSAVYYSLAGLLGLGPIKEITSLWLNGRRISHVGDTSQGGTGDVATPLKTRPTNPLDPEYYFADVAFKLHNKSSTIHLRIYWGDPNQPADPLLSGEQPFFEATRGSYSDGWAHKGGNVTYDSSKLYIGRPPNIHPAYSGIAYVIFYTFETDFSLREGGSSIGDIQFEVVAEAKSFADANDLADSAKYGVNPVAILRDMVQDPIFGMGLPNSVIDDAAWEAACERFSSEGLHIFSGSRVKESYISPLITESRNAESLLAAIMDYFDGFLRYEGGKLIPDWFQHRLNEGEGLPEINRLKMTSELKRVDGELDSWDDTINELEIEFTDASDKWGNGSRKATSGYNFKIVEEPRKKTIEARWIINANTAHAMASRRLQSLVVPRGNYQCELPFDLAVRGDGSPLTPGDLAWLDYGPYSLDTIVRVIERVERGSLVTLTLQIEPGNSPVEYIAPDDTRQLPQQPEAEPFTAVRVWELPVELARQSFPPRAVILARRENISITHAAVYVSVNGDFLGEEQEVLQLSSFTGWARLNAAIDNSDATLTLKNISADAQTITNISYSDSEQADDVIMALIGNELVTLGALTPPSGDTRTYAILRGRKGTIAASHNADAEVWVFRRSALQIYDHGSFRLKPPYSTGAATTYWRLQAVSPRSESDISASFELVLVNPFPTIDWVTAPVDTAYNRENDWEVEITNTTGQLMRVAIGLAGPANVWIPLYYLETTDAVVTWASANPILPSQGGTGTWRLGVWASYVARSDETLVAIGQDFTVAEPTLNLSLTPPGNATQGFIQSFAGTISNPDGLQVDWTLFVDKGSTRKFVYTGTSFDTTIAVAASRLWTETDLGAWTLTLIAQHRYADSPLKTDQEGFTLIAPTLTPSVNTPSNTAQGKSEVYSGSISNPAGLLTRFVLMLEKGAQTIILISNVSNSTSINMSAPKLWTAEEAGTWTLRLDCYHIYEGAPAHPVTADETFSVSATSITANFSLPAADAVLLHRQKYDVEFTITNPQGIDCIWNLIYQGPEIGGIRRNILFSSGENNATATIRTRLDTALIDLYTLAQQAASPYRLRLRVVSRLGSTQAEAFRSFTVSLPQPMSAHFGAKTVEKLSADGYHLRDGDLRSEGGAELRYEEATTSWKRQTATKIVSATRPDGTEIYRSDFSGGANGWTNGNFGIVAGNQDAIGGKNDVLKIYADGTAFPTAFYHSAFRPLTWVTGRIYRVRFSYYIPSGQTNVIAFRPVWYAGDSAPASPILSGLDEWKVADFIFDPATAGFGLMELILHNGLGPSDNKFDGLNDPNDDRVYIRDFVFIDITDGQEVIHNDRWIDTSDDYKAYLYDADLLKWNRDNTTFTAARITTGTIEAAIINLFGSAILKGDGDTDIDTGTGLFFRGEEGTTKAQFRVGDVTGQHLLFDGQAGEFSFKVLLDALTDTYMTFDNTGLRMASDLTIEHIPIAGISYVKVGSAWLWAGGPVGYLQLGTYGTPVSLLKLYEAQGNFSATASLTVIIDITGDGFIAAPNYAFITIVAGPFKIVAQYDKANSSSTELRIKLGTVDGSSHTGDVDIQVQAID